MIVLTEKQFENVYILHKEIIKKYPDFIGFNGSKDKMDVLGITDKEAQAEIEKIDIDTLIPKPMSEKEKLLEILGLTEGHLTKIKALP